MKATITKDVVEKIQSYLGDCSQRVICRYLGVSTVALSQNIEKEFSKILDNKVGKRLDVLLFLLECAKKDATLEASILHRLITLPAYEDKEGWKLDIVSAIHDDASKGMVIEIFQRAVAELRKPIDSKPVADGLYNVVHAKRA